MRNYSRPRGIVRTGHTTSSPRSYKSHPKGNLGYFYNLQPPPRYSERLYKIPDISQYGGFSRYAAGQEYQQRQKQNYQDYITGQQRAYMMWRTRTNLFNAKRAERMFKHGYQLQQAYRYKYQQPTLTRQIHRGRGLRDKLIGYGRAAREIARDARKDNPAYEQVYQSSLQRFHLRAWKTTIGAGLLLNRAWPQAKPFPPTTTNSRYPCMEYNVWKKTWLPCSQDFLQTKRRKFYNAYETPVTQRQHRSSNRSRRYYRTHQFTTNPRNTFAYRGYRRHNDRRLRKQLYYSIY